MGNTQERVVNSVDLIMGVLAGVDMLEALREGMLKQRVPRSDRLQSRPGCKPMAGALRPQPAT